MHPPNRVTLVDQLPEVRSSVPPPFHPHSHPQPGPHRAIRQKNYAYSPTYVSNTIIDDSSDDEGDDERMPAWFVKYIKMQQYKQKAESKKHKRHSPKHHHGSKHHRSPKRLQCAQVCKHIRHCPVCSQIHSHGSSYTATLVIVIIILIVLCIYLYKRNGSSGIYFTQS